MKFLKLITILFISTLLFSISFAKYKINGNGKYRCDCIPKLDGYFERFKGNDKKTGEPIFYGKIRKEDIKDYPYYFKKYTYLDKNKKNKKIAFRYIYYKNKIKLGDYYFSYQLTKKVILKKAIWYNINGKIAQYNIYRIRSNDNINRHRNIFRYYNDFGVLIRKIIYVYENNNIIKINNITDFTPEEHILGEKEY